MECQARICPTCNNDHDESRPCKRGDLLARIAELKRHDEITDEQLLVIEARAGTAMRRLDSFRAGPFTAFGGTALMEARALMGEILLDIKRRNGICGKEEKDQETNGHQHEGKGVADVRQTSKAVKR